MVRDSRFRRLVRSSVVSLLAVVMVMQPLGVSAASAEIYGYHDYVYPDWSKFTSQRTGTGALLRFDQWSGLPMHIGWGYCGAAGPVAAAYSTVSGWANIGYPPGLFCLFTRPPGSSIPAGPACPFSGLIEY